MGVDDDIASAPTAVGTQPSPLTSPADAPPSVLASRYEVLALLGVGGMGRVYRVHDRTLDETVALKLLRRELVDDPAALERFRQEVKLARRVTHPNVVRTFDLGVHEADHFLTMELIDGRSLAQRLDDGLLPLDELLRIAREACAGIAAAHNAGVLHRDLKPDNILVARDGRIAITDFGIAKASGDIGHEQAGTPAYMAPEQVSGDPVGPPADVYAFGAILFEMVTGARPFVGNDVSAVMRARLTKPAPDPRQFCVVPDDLAELVLRCLATDPARRLASGAALATALAEIDTARMAARAAPAPQAVPAKSSRSVALLPLRATGDLTEIADGLAEEIVDALTNTRALRVRPLSSVRSVVDAHGDAQATGRALGVDVVVDGSVRRRGDQVRIGARAIGVIDGFQLWSSHVDCAPAGLLTAGDEIARAIARALTVEIDVPARGETDPRATALYLEHKARLRLDWDTGDVAESIKGLEQAAALAPDEPSIVATLAMAYARSAFFGEQQNLQRARHSAERAIALAPTSGEAQLALGLAHLYATDVAAAARSLTLAVRNAPGLARAQALLGALLLEADSLDEAILHLEGAQALDPLGPQSADLPRAYVYAGRPASDVDALAAAYPGPKLLMDFILARFTMWRGELASYAFDRTFFVGWQQQYFEILWRVHHSRVLSAADLATMVEGTLVPNPRLRATRSQFLAEFLMFCDMPDKAMEYVNVSVSSGLQDHCWMVRCPLLEPLRQRDEFQRLASIVDARARDVRAAVHDALKQ